MYQTYKLLQQLTVMQAVAAGTGQNQRNQQMHPALLLPTEAAGYLQQAHWQRFETCCPLITSPVPVLLVGLISHLHQPTSHGHQVPAAAAGQDSTQLVRPLVSPEARLNHICRT
jgi:hypothetical protein